MCKLPQGCFFVSLPLFSVPRPPSMSGCAGSRYAAPCPLPCHASLPPLGAPCYQKKNRRAITSGGGSHVALTVTLPLRKPCCYLLPFTKPLYGKPHSIHVRGTVRQPCLLPALHQHCPLAGFFRNIGIALFTREVTAAGFVGHFVGIEEGFDGLAVDGEVDVLPDLSGRFRHL